MLFSLHVGYQDHSVAVEMVSGADCRDILSDGDLLDHADQVLAPRVHDQSVVEAELRVSDPHPADVTLSHLVPVLQSKSLTIGIMDGIQDGATSLFLNLPPLLLPSFFTNLKWLRNGE